MNFNKKTIRRMLTRMCTLTICLILIITQTACTANEKTNGNTGVSKTGFFLDTLCSITIFGIYDLSGELLELSEDELNQKLLLLITDAFKLCDKYEKMLSKTIETSDVARINAAGGKAVKVSGETVEVIRKGSRVLLTLPSAKPQTFGVFVRPRPGKAQNPEWWAKFRKRVNLRKR